VSTDNPCLVAERSDPSKTLSSNMQNLLLVVILVMISCQIACTQNIVHLPTPVNNAEVKWDRDRMSYFSEIWQTEVVTNVSKPTLEIFLAEEPNGAAVVICPGGGLYAHSIESEGRLVAKALNEVGVSAFVLEYRLVPTGEDGVADITREWQNLETKVSQVLPLSISDAQQAILHLRSNADQYQIDTDRIGLMGFSAGGAVTMGVTYANMDGTAPDFIAPVYFWEDAQPIMDVPLSAGPAFILCASDDGLDLGPASVELYQSWIKAGKSAELHMYSKGDHGFGMRDTEFPVGTWIHRFTDWMKVEGLMQKR